MKTTLRYHFTLNRMTIKQKQKLTSVSKNLEKLEAPHINAENTNWHGYCRKSLVFPPKLSLELPHNPATSLLYPLKMKTGIQTDSCTPIFPTAVFTIAKSWK